jgi:hypothetical protein
MDFEIIREEIELRYGSGRKAYQKFADECGISVETVYNLMMKRKDSFGTVYIEKMCNKLNLKLCIQKLPSRLSSL